MKSRRVRQVSRVPAFIAVLVTLVSGSPNAGAAQGSAAVNVSDSTRIAVVRGKPIRIPLLVLPAGGLDIASLQGALTWGASRLRFDSVKTGPFGTLTPNTAGAAAGSILLSSFRATAQTARDTIANIFFTADTTSASPATSGIVGGTRMLFSPTAAGNELGSNILSNLIPRGLDVCVVSGAWGDVNNDGSVNIIDAQQIARKSVGLPIANDSAMAQRGDVTADGNTNIIDAQQAARFSVGLSAAARSNTPAFTAPTVASVVVTPSGAQSVNVGATVQLSADPRNAANASLQGCASVIWTTSDATKATVSPSGLVTGVAAGTATITATSGGQTATATVNVGPGAGGTVASLQLLDGPDSYGYQNAGVQVLVQAKNAGGGPVAGATVSYAVTGGAGRFSGATSTTVVTDSMGIAVGVFTLGAGALETNTLTVAASGAATLNATATSISRSLTRHICMGNNASVRCWGDNSQGQLGNGTTTSSLTPVNVSLAGIALALPQTTSSVSREGFGDHTCLLDDAGKAHCWGANVAGQLGDSTRTNRSVPTAVRTALSFTAIGTGYQHTCALTGAGDIYCWGLNNFGQLGDNTANNARLGPTKVAAPAGVLFSVLAVGENHTCAIAQASAAWCWGLNSSGQLGNGTILATSTTRAILPVSGGFAFTALAGGTAHTCGITAAGAAYCWGTRSSGTLGDGSLAGVAATTPIQVLGGHAFQAIHAGVFYSCGIKADLQAWCWGLGFGGHFGDGTVATSYAVPTLIAFTGSDIRINGNNNIFSEITTCGLAPTTRQVLCWGTNAHGAIGDGTTTQRVLPTVVAHAGAPATAGAVLPVAPLGLQGAVGGTAVPVNPTVTVRDRLGAPLAGATVEFVVSAGGGSVANATAVTDAGGQATAGAWTLGATLGANTLVARVAATAPSGSGGFARHVFVATGASTPASIAIVGGDNQVVGSGGTYVAPLAVLVRDALSNPVVGLPVTFAITSGTGTLSGGGLAFTDANGNAQVTATVTSAATQTITATVSGVAPVTFNLRGAANSFNDSRCELTSAGAAYCWGANSRGQVGDGTTTNRLVPTAVTGGVTFASIAEGSAGDHSCGLTAAGVAYCWGANGFGQLGDNTFTDRTAPTLVSGGITFTKLVRGASNTCGLTGAGVLHCWGWASNGIYADGSIGTVRLVPTVVTTGGLTFTDVAVGSSHICAVSTSAPTYCWGTNPVGQLGDGTITPRTTPTQVAGGNTFAKITVGANHSCGMTAAGAVYCWGVNVSGQLGDGTTSTRLSPVAVGGGFAFAAIAAAGNVTCGVSSAGVGACWGLNTSGQVGIGTLTNVTTPTFLAGGITWTKLSPRTNTVCGRSTLGAGQPYCWGSGTSGAIGNNSTALQTMPTPVTWVEGTPGTAVSTVISTGNNQGAVAGTAVPLPVAVLVRDYANNPVAGVSITFSPTNGGGSVTGSPAVTNASGIATLGSWTLGPSPGLNTLAAQGSGLFPVTFTAQATLAPASITISSGDNQVQATNTTYLAQLIALVKDGSNNPLANVAVTFAVASGGGSISGSSIIFTDANGLARGSAVTPSGAGVQTVTATAPGLAPLTFNLRAAPFIGSDSRCELTSTGAAYCWGANGRGQIGDGTTAQRQVPTAVSGGITFASLAEGSGDHYCGLTPAGAAYCWGPNAFGELGDNTTTDRTTPVLVSGGLTFTKLAISGASTCGRTAAGTLYCWGWAGNGIYGDGAIGIVRLTPTAVTAPGLAFSDIAISTTHACGIAAAGAMYCWGLNTNGQVGDGTFTSPRAAPTPVSGGFPFTSVTVGSAFSCGLLASGQSYCWGSNGSGQLGNGNTGTTTIPVTNGTNFNLASISASNSTVCGRTSAGAAYCWGLNNVGQLGDGTTTNRSNPTPVLGGLGFSAVRVRLTTVCGRANAGNAQPFCWGYNGNGQVGDNTTTQRVSPVPVVWVEGTPGAAVSMVVNAGNNQGAVAGAVVPLAPSVTVRDFANNPVAGVSVTFTPTSGGGSVTGSPAVTNASGIASVGSWTLGAAVGTNTLTASATGLPSPVFTATATAPPASITISAGDNQAQSDGSAYLGQLTVLVRDASNVAMTNVGVTFAVASGGGSISGSPVVLTDASGLARASVVAPAAAGQQSVTATVSGLAPVTFNLRAAGLSGGETRCELTTSGAAYCWGVNARGQIGDGTTTNRLVPTAVGGGLIFASLAEGAGDHACGLASAGAAYCWGANSYGQLGDNTITDRTAPTLVGGGLTFTKLVLGPSTTCGLTAAGGIYCWGWASWGIYADGQVGIVRLVPTAVTAPGLAFTDIAVGRFHMCGVASTAAMYCWGHNIVGQVGDGTLAGPRTAVTAVAGGLAFVSVTVSGYYSCGLTTAGAAYCWGSGGNGALGNGSTSLRNTPTAVLGGLSFASISAAGEFYTTCGRTAAGAAYCWGWNGNGGVGDGTATDRLVPTAVLGGIAVGKIATRSVTVCARTTAGSQQPFCWGANSIAGQFGDGTTSSPRPTPGPVTWVEGTPGTAVSVVLSAGNNQSATTGTNVAAAPSVLVRDYAGNPVAGVSVTFAITSGGGSVAGSSATTNASGIASPTSWTLGAAAGLNTLSATMTGIGTIVFTATGTVPTTTFTALTVGEGHTCGRTSAGAAYCWGSNSNGQIGDGTATNRSTPVAVQGGLAFTALTAGGHTCGLTSAGAAYCWGRNVNGGLGDGTTTDRLTPVPVQGGLVFTSLTVGEFHTCGLTSAGAAYCWGHNFLGTLGDGTTTQRLTPVAVQGGLAFTALSGGWYHTCGLTSAGTAHCWGRGDYGQLGDGTTSQRVSPVAVQGGLVFMALTASQFHSCGLTTAGAAYCWGYNAGGALGDGTTTTRLTPVTVQGGLVFTALPTGTGHTCGRTSAGAAYCWGTNSHGQLGDGTNGTNRLTPVAVQGALVFTALTAGGNHSCGLTGAGAAYCWGSNSAGEVGDGTSGTSRWTPVAVLPP